MPFISNNTPEANLPRTDSKNPSTTCRGITSSGRPCRRALKNENDSFLSDAAVNVVIEVNPDDATYFFCWQHKDQARSQKLERKETKLFELKERTSIDTLISRLGGLDITDVDATSKTKPNKRKQESKTSRSSANRKKTKSRKHPRPSFLSILCCGAQEDDDDYIEVIRHKKRLNPPANAVEAQPSSPRPQNGRKTWHEDNQAVHSALPNPLVSPEQPKAGRSNNLLSWIPSSLPPPVMSRLLNELAKPLSHADDYGYIYIFWLTDAKQEAPSTSVASSLLTRPLPAPHTSGRRRSDLLRQYSVSTKPGAGENNNVLLKIGRASNVHRRMNEWTRQCGYNLSLIRFYPYVSSTTVANSSSPSRDHQTVNQRPVVEPQRSHSGIRKAPHVQRVERLIHIELSSQRVDQGTCSACGKEHREWFEIEASEAGLRGVDAVIRRWVRWSEDFAANHH